MLVYVCMRVTVLKLVGLLFLACAMPCLGSAELSRAIWDRLLAAKSEPEARLCKVALGALTDAEIQRAFTEDVRRGAEHRDGRIMPQEDDKKLGEQHEHLNNRTRCAQ